MSGLLRRLTRRRPATADESRSPTAGSSEPAAAPADAPAEPGGDRPVPAADEQQTQVLPATGEQSAVEQTSPGAEWAKSAAAQPASAGETAQPATADQPAQPVIGPRPATAAAEPAQPVAADQPTAFAAQPSPVRDLPAGVDPGDLASAPPASARRGKLRRRLRYLRHVRELLLRDLGGFTYEVHRTAGGTPQESHRRLSEAKASRISALDAEVGALESQLREPHAETLLREAGIGGTCPECGELHASDAHFCSRCGAPLDAKARAQRQAAIAAAAPPVTASHPTPEPQPASVLWAGGPRPSARREPDEKEQPAAVTSEWLRTRDQPTTFDRAAQPDEPAAPADEPPAAPASDEPAAPDKPAAASDEPAAPDTPAATSDEPAAADTPAAASDESAAADTPAATSDEPAAADTPAATSDEPAAADTPAAKSDEPAAAAGDEAAAKPAKPKRRPRKAAPKRPADKPAADSGTPFEPGPNGRRDEDVPPPVTSGDPLASHPREQTP